MAVAKSSKKISKAKIMSENPQKLQKINEQKRKDENINYGRCCK